MRSFRSSPSLTAPRRAIAFCEGSFRLSVCSHTRLAPSLSNACPLEPHRPGVELRPRLLLDESHLHVVEEQPVSRNTVALDALDDEAGGLVHPDRTIVVAHNAQADPVQAQLALEVTHLELQCVAAEVLAPEFRLADPDADLGTLRLRLVVPKIRKANGAALVLDHPASCLTRPAHVLDPSAGHVLFEPPGAHAPLVPAELRVASPPDQVR